MEIDLRGNQLSSVEHLHMLPQLQHLNLDENIISSIVDSQGGEANTSLKSLSICRNELTALKISSMFPNLEHVRADQNRLSDVSDLDNLRHLRSLSVRGQQVAYSESTASSGGSLMTHPDLQDLSLSENVLSNIDLSGGFLNLQRLELSTCGLQSLPETFGVYMPNVRTLNLNFNAIKDLRPLLNTKKIDELFVAGNRLSRLRRNLAVLAKLNTLTKIDLRENPLTVGFYPPAVERRLVPANVKSIEGADNHEAYTLPEQDREADQQYSSRLDGDTRLRRRVYEMMLATSCSRLHSLDGLLFDSKTVLVKDEIWERLLMLGVLKKSSKQGNLLE